jgi:hypothetical protein
MKRASAINIAEVLFMKYYVNLSNSHGKLDFEKFAASEVFSQGIEKIKTALSLGYIITLMCAE